MIRLAGPGDAAGDYEIATAAEVKAHMQLANSNDDTLLASIVAGCNRAAFPLLGGRFIKRGSVDFDDVCDVESDDCTRVYLDQYPISSVTSVSLVSLLGNDTLQLQKTYAATDYQIDRSGGALVLVRYGVWPEGQNVLRVLYKAGWAAGSIPGDLVKAICEWSSVIYSRVKNKRLDVTSIALADQQQTFAIDAMPRSARNTIDGYKRAVIF